MKMLSNRLFFFFPFFLSVIAQAQENNPTLKHSIGLQFGINQVKEKILHPKTSTGTITELSYGFEKRNLKWKHFHFTIDYSRPKTKLEDLSKSINLKLNIDYSLGFNLIQKNNFKYYLGPELGLAYNVVFFPNWDDSHLYWADYLSIGARNAFSVQFNNKCAWTSAVSFPLFSVFSRPDPYRLYKIDDTDFQGVIRSFNNGITAAHLVNVFYIRIQSEYRFPIFKNKAESFIYSFEWQRVKKNNGNPFQQLSHQIGIKLFL